MKRMLRTAAALLLGASLLVTGASAAATQFDDVPANHWAYSYVTRAAQEGLVSGMGDGVYGESEPLNLGEFATMICQLLCGPLLLLVVSVCGGRLSEGRPDRHRGREPPGQRRGLDRHRGGGGYEPL